MFINSCDESEAKFKDHSTWVFFPQPEQLELEITDSSLTTNNVTRHTVF